MTENILYLAGFNKIKFDNHSSNSSDNLTERLEIILETDADHDGSYIEMLNMSKKLLSMKIIKKEQLDSFVFNYGK